MLVPINLKFNLSNAITAIFNINTNSTQFFIVYCFKKFFNIGFWHLSAS